MSQGLRRLYRVALTVAAVLSLAVTRPAFATDPLPNDSVAPPSGSNLVLYYNIFSDSGGFVPPHGSGESNARVVTDVNVIRDV